jgi:hypothetical protein
LSALPAGGVIEPFSNATVTVKFDATDMEDGTYAGSISVSSNDPDTPSWSIPASMQVASFICGDINGDGVSSDISDLIYLVDYSFNDGAEPPTLAAADVDGSGELDVSDLIYLAEYQFGTGPAPQCQ